MDRPTQNPSQGGGGDRKNPAIQKEVGDTLVFDISTPDGFETELGELKNGLMNFALKLTKDRSKAKDLCQETAIKAWEGRENFGLGTKGSINARLRKIMYNHFINDYRGNKIRRHILDTQEITDRTELGKVHNQAESDLKVQQLMEDIRSLNPVFSKAFLLHYKGYEYSEIARMTGVPIGTVKSRISHARKHLQSMINKREVK